MIMYGWILENRIDKEIINIKEQIRFRAGESTCIDNRFSLRQLTENRTERNLETHLAFVDLEKAYNSVSLLELFATLE